MSSTNDDKHLSALVKELMKLCTDYSLTCPNAERYLDMLSTGEYTENDLDEIIEQFSSSCEICDRPHCTDVCPHRQEETQCDECGTVCENSRALNEHRDQWGNCPLTNECDNCGEIHYTSDCPWCKTCVLRREKCKCNDVPSP
jgi:hypothetical protein